MQYYIQIADREENGQIWIGYYCRSEKVRDEDPDVFAEEELPAVLVRAALAGYSIEVIEENDSRKSILTLLAEGISVLSNEANSAKNEAHTAKKDVARAEDILRAMTATLKNVIEPEGSS